MISTRSLPPSISTMEHPDDIVGPIRGTLANFIRDTYSAEPGNFESAAAKYGGSREKIADALRRCRDIGYYPDGVDSNNRIVWRQRLDNRPDYLEWRRLEKPGKFSKSEIAAMRKKCRDGMNRFNKSSTINIEVE